MELRNMKLTSVCLLLTCVLQAFSVEVHTTEKPPPLLCYVCENCAEESQYDTKLAACNEEYFASTTVTDATITETTPALTTAPIPTQADTTTHPPTTTTTTTTPLPTTISIVHTTMDESTLPPLPPTPSTVGPPENTTLPPTPPNPGTVIVPVDNNTNLTHFAISTNTTPSVEYTIHNSQIDHTPPTLILPGSLGGRSSRQERAADSHVTFHCYRAVWNVNGSMVTNRGCSRVTTMESVCGLVKQMNDMKNSKINKCYACSETLCNGSRALAVSATTLLLAVLAALLHRN